MTDHLPALVEPAGLVTRWERAVYWLGEATRVDEVVSIRNEAEQLKVAGRQARDRSLTANAVELQLRAERRLGEILVRAKEAGQLGRGRIARGANGSEPELFPVPGRISLEDAGIDKKLSMKSQQLASKPATLFEQVVAEARAKIEAGRAIVVNPLKELNTAEKKVRRRIREAQLAARQKALPDRLYGVIYADPEWRFEVRSEAGLDRAADNHYPTSDLATIKARPVGTLAAPDCALFLWVTVPHLAQGLEVMRFWGFTYKSSWTWDKIDVGNGFWNRNRHEVLLLGTRGSVPAPAPGTQYPSVMAERAREHSRKPDWGYELIEAYFPNLPKIELNARQRRPGWDAWGLEAPDGRLDAGTEGAGGQSRDGLSPASVAPPSSGLRPPSPIGGEGEDRHPQSDVDADVEAQELIELNSPPDPLMATTGTGEADPNPKASPVFSSPPSGRGQPVGGPFRSTPETDAVIRRHYAADVVDFEALCAELGASKLQARRRANQLGLGSRRRQLAATLALPRAEGGRFLSQSPEPVT